MEARVEIQQLLDQYGFILARHKNHFVWKNPAGVQVVLPKTPSDFRSYDNVLTDLKRRLGIIQPHMPGERRPKKLAPKPAPPRLTLQAPAEPSAQRPTWQDQLATLKPLLMQRLPTRPPVQGSKAHRIEFEISEDMIRWLVYGMLIDAQKHLRNHKSGHEGDKLAIRTLTEVMERVVCPDMKPF